MTVSEAAERLGVARSTAHRLLAMLVYRDFATQLADRRYAVGPALSPGLRPSAPVPALRPVVVPHLTALVERVEETANVQVLAGDLVRFVASVECSRALRVGDREGMVFPAHLTSGGKVLLADLPDEELAERFVGAGGPDLAALRTELRAVRENGFALNVGRTEAGLTAVGRPIRPDGRRAEAAVSVSMPSSRFSEERLPQIVAALAATARDIEAVLNR
ncbi:IclR family transcriptional regulator [Blastococcus sp. TF02A-26]|nr:IclR family transcriptional regulator [Blastococcus sp. TF02A-26]